jgi:hypothetical protein
MPRALFVGLALAAALTLATGAGEAAPPAVPVFVQSLVKHRAGQLAYAPTRVPLSYRYRSFRVAPATKTVTYRFVRVPTARNQPPITVTIVRYRRPLSACGAGKQQTLQMGGNKVYWDGTVAWRCMRFAGGAAQASVTGAADPARFATKFAYGRVAASVRRIP